MEQPHIRVSRNPFRVIVGSPLGHGIRSLTLFGKPLMADDTEITVSRSSIP
jgi:hypothetical protein